MDDDGPVWRRTDQCRGGQTSAEEDGPVWRRTAQCGGGRTCAEEDGPVWRRTDQCGGGQTEKDRVRRGQPGTSRPGAAGGAGASMEDIGNQL